MKTTEDVSTEKLLARCARIVEVLHPGGDAPIEFWHEEEGYVFALRVSEDSIPEMVSKGDSLQSAAKRFFGLLTSAPTVVLEIIAGYGEDT